MSTISLYRGVRQKLDEWRDKHIPEGPNFIVNVREFIKEAANSYDDSSYHILVKVDYDSSNGVYDFFKVEYTAPLYQIGPALELRVSNMVLFELTNLLEKGKLDKVIDGTFKGW